MPIYEGQTVAEAVNKGLSALSITKEEAVVEVIEEAKKGFLGMGKKNARVSVEPSVAEEISEAVTETVAEVTETAPELELVEEEVIPAEEAQVETVSTDFV